MVGSSESVLVWLVVVRECVRFVVSLLVFRGCGVCRCGGLLLGSRECVSGGW